MQEKGSPRSSGGVGLGVLLAHHLDGSVNVLRAGRVFLAGPFLPGSQTQLVALAGLDQHCFKVRYHKLLLTPVVVLGAASVKRPKNEESTPIHLFGFQ